METNTKVFAILEKQSDFPHLLLIINITSLSSLNASVLVSASSAKSTGWSRRLNCGFTVSRPARPQLLVAMEIQPGHKGEDRDSDSRRHSEGPDWSPEAEGRRLDTLNPQTTWKRWDFTVQSGDTRRAKRSSTPDPKTPSGQKRDFQTECEDRLQLQQTPTCPPPAGGAPTDAPCPASSPTWQPQQQRASREGQPCAAMATSLPGDMRCGCE